MERDLKIGDDVAVLPLEDSKQDFLYRGYIGRIMKIDNENSYAFIDTKASGLFQSVTFKAWIPIEKLTRVG